MANSNVNIANRLFAYIKHGVDITEDIKQMYQNSLILIGDEKQIYVPAKNAYVGISMTSYNITNSRIDDVSYRLDQLANTLSQDLVSKIYPNYSIDEYNQYSSNMSSTDFIKMNNEITIKALGNYAIDPADRPKDANDNIIGNVVTSYNLARGTSKDGENGTVVNVNDDPRLFDKGQLYANSGITITPHYGGTQQFENPQTGQIITKQVGNYIVIDDKQTWSYMTSAYSYTLNYAQQYTNSEVERLYHNLLGTGHKVFVPVSIDSVFIDVVDTFDSREVSNPASAADYDWTSGTGDDTKYYAYIIPSDVIVIEHDNVKDYYRFNDREYYYRQATPQTIYNPDYDDIATQTEYVAKTKAQIITEIQNSQAGNDYVKYDETETAAAIHRFPVNQIYVIEEEDVNTYNMNLRDGINTLKEVAYILDQLTDGQLGKVTYLTYSQYNNCVVIPQDYNEATNPGVKYAEDGTASQLTDNNVNLYYIRPQNSDPNDNDIYAYVVNTMDPDNLGIQIAYSISGNKAQIDDLHRHVELNEEGKTSLRSINTTETELASIVMRGGFSSFTNASQTDQENGAYWVNTDTNNAQEADPMGHPNNVDSTWPARDYRVGDVDIRLKLDVATTYSTVNSVAKPDLEESTTEFGVEYRGIYQKADMTQLSDASTYYTYTGGAMVVVPAADLATAEYDYTKLPTGTQYYWIPAEDEITATTDINNANINLKLKEITAAELADLIANNATTIPGIAKYGDPATDYNYIFRKDNNDDLVVVGSGGNWLTAAQSYLNDHPDDKLYYASEITPVEYHPLIVEKNQIATTDWVGAYVDAKVSDVGDELENILDAAKEYTDNRINGLDSNYAYSDFQTNVWGPVQAIYNYTPGSTTYTTAYNNLYQHYVNGDPIHYPDSANSEFDFTDYSNTLRNHAQSEYVYNVTEENGIVSAEARELPSDRIIVENNIWGHEESDQPYTFAALEAQNTTSALLNTLYNWVKAASNDYPQNQLFVQDGTAFSKVPTTSALDTANVDYYEYLSYNNQYTLYEPELGFDYTDTNSYNWRQLYTVTPKYVEIDLASAQLTSSDAANVNPSDPQQVATARASVNTLVFNDKYTITKDDQSGAISVSGNSTGSSSSLYYIANGDNAPSEITHKVEYLTSTQKHFDYTNGGHGENELKVKANIVKLEDAKADNTGFADAFDVKTYIDNLFRWVDISASIDQSTLLTRDAFFKHITLAEYNAAGANKPTLYKKNAGNYEAVAVANIQTAFYYYADNVCDPALNSGTGTTSNTSGRGTVTIDNVAYYAREEFDVNGYGSLAFNLNNKYNSSCDYYINIETASINPLNLAETLYGA